MTSPVASKDPERDHRALPRHAPTRFSTLSQHPAQSHSPSFRPHLLTVWPVPESSTDLPVCSSTRNFFPHLVLLSLLKPSLRKKKKKPSLKQPPTPTNSSHPLIRLVILSLTSLKRTHYNLELEIHVYAVHKIIQLHTHGYGDLIYICLTDFNVISMRTQPTSVSHMLCPVPATQDEHMSK